MVGLPAEPVKLSEALSGPEAPHWQEAVNVEMASLTSMGTWELCDLPRGKKSIPCRWVFKRKLTPSGSIERYKARLVVKGFHQRYGVDYDNVFAPVVRASTVRVFLSLCAIMDYELHSVDITNAFVQGTLDEDVYMTQPPGYDDGTTKVCKLLKSLYGLKQAPRVWSKKLQAFLLSLGAVQCLSDGALYILESHRGRVILLVYVDDILLASANKASVLALKHQILHQFPGKDLGETDFFLQVSIQRDRRNRTIYLSQRRHIEKIVTACNLDAAKTKSIPMISKVYADPSGPLLGDAPASQYRSIIGGIMHISNYTRPDVAFAVNYLSRFMASPAANHLARAKDIVTYLKGSAALRLRLGGATAPIFHGCCDADFAACVNTRKSTSGYALFLGTGIVDWQSRRQATVSRSTAEAEYIAAGEISKAVSYMTGLGMQLKIPHKTIAVGIDNQAAKALTEDPLSASRTKHVDIAYHHVRDRVQHGLMTLNFLPSMNNTADIMTKPLGHELFVKHRNTLGVV